MDISLMNEEQMELFRRAVAAMEQHAAAMDQLANVVTFAIVAPIALYLLIWLFRQM